jgi:hypothetical protein
VFTLSPPTSRTPTWLSRSQPKIIKHSSLARPIFSTVIDTTSGRGCDPSAPGLDRIATGDDRGRWDPCLWVAASQNRLRTYAGVAGREIAGVERKSGKELVCIDVVEIQGEYDGWVYTIALIELSIGEAVVVVIECNGEATVYSLPRLEKLNTFSIGQVTLHISHAHTLTLPQTPRPARQLRFSGRFFDHLRERLD